MSESNHDQPLIMIALSQQGATVFKNVVGEGWVGESFRQRDGSVLVRNPRRLRAGLHPGSSDIIGWTPVEVTPDMVGKKLAVFTAIEVKTASGRASKEQLNFLKMVREAGGLSGIARSPTEAVLLIGKKLL